MYCADVLNWQSVVFATGKLSFCEYGKSMTSTLRVAKIAHSSQHPNWSFQTFLVQLSAKMLIIKRKLCFQLVGGDEHIEDLQKT